MKKTLAFALALLMVLSLAIIIIFPQIALWLPDLYSAR